MPAATSRFWLVRGQWQDGMARLRDALESAQSSGANQAKGLIACGHLACQLGDYVTAESFYLHSVAIRRELNDECGVAVSLNNAGLAHLYQDNPSGARPLFLEALETFRNYEQLRAVAALLHNIATTAQRPEEAEDLLHEALGISIEIDDSRTAAACIGELGRVAIWCGDLDDAEQLALQSIEAFRNLEDLLGVAEGLQCLGDVAALENQPDRAREHYQESLSICKVLFARRHVAEIRRALDRLRA